MNNEYYYLQELENRMQDFLTDENNGEDFGILPDFISRRMAEAAFAVLKNSRELSDYLQREDMLK